MSIELIESQIRRSLKTDEPEVICISGKWGVGKTFAWNRYLREAQADNAIALKRYSYVSLFGVNSLEELKYSIFENSVNSSEIGVEPSLETLRSNTSATAARFGRKSLWFVQQIPLLKNYIGGLGPVWFLSVKETIVCVDDVERRGASLSVRDVLGLVANLKEHKRCKVFLILNDEALEEHKAEFATYLDKVVDTSLRFAPSSEECARIAITADTEMSKVLRECCVTLGISNIRVIKKIERAVQLIEPTLKDFDEHVLQLAVQSLALFGWSLYEPMVAPSIDYLEKRKQDLFHNSEKETIPEKEAAWNALLDAYGFVAMDEFDRVLLNGIRNGFFDDCLIENHASELNRKVMASRVDHSFTSAWAMYHDSFADNQQQVLDAIYQSVFNNTQRMTVLDLNATVWLFKALGRANQAAEIIEQYTASHCDNRKAYDLDHYPFKEKIDDPDIIKAFQDKLTTFKDERSAADILGAMADRHGWDGEDINALSTSSVDEYYNTFKKTEGPDLRKIINACLQFDRLLNATQPMLEISKRAKAALMRIGQESPINALRVKKYGVEAGVITNGGDSQE